MAGVVQRVDAELGDAVQEGQVLLVLDDAREQARVEAATAAAELARAQFKRLDGLGTNGFVTTAQIDSARFALRSAEAALHEAQIDLEHTRVTAPFAGVITRRTTGRGRPVRIGEPLFRLTALQPLRALVRVSERAARGLRVGAAAELSTDEGVRVAARIQRVSPATDPESGTVEVLLEVPRPGPLRPGSSASARLGK
jgi:RND family efflux transporter MFP subunit